MSAENPFQIAAFEPYEWLIAGPTLRNLCEYTQHMIYLMIGVQRLKERMAVLEGILPALQTIAGGEFGSLRHVLDVIEANLITRRGPSTSLVTRTLVSVQICIAVLRAYERPTIT